MLEDYCRYLERVGDDIERAKLVMHRVAVLDHRLKVLLPYEEAATCLSLLDSLTRNLQ